MGHIVLSRMPRASWPLSDHADVIAFAQLLYRPCTTPVLPLSRLQAVQDMCMHKMAERLYQGLQQVWGWV